MTQHLRRAAEEALIRRTLDDLEAAAIPTKSEVFVVCGHNASELRTAILSLLDERDRLREALTAVHEWSDCTSAKRPRLHLLPAELVEQVEAALSSESEKS